MYDWVEKNKSWSRPPVTGAQGDEVPLEESGAFLTNGTFAYCLSGKVDYFQLVQKWALNIYDFSEKTIANYCIGIYTVGLARTFGWFYHNLEIKEWEKIKSTVVRVVQSIYTILQILLIDIKKI